MWSGASNRRVQHFDESCRHTLRYGVVHIAAVRQRWPNAREINERAAAILDANQPAVGILKELTVGQAINPRGRRWISQARLPAAPRSYARQKAGHHTGTPEFFTTLP